MRTAAATLSESGPPLVRTLCSMRFQLKLLGSATSLRRFKNTKPLVLSSGAELLLMTLR